MFTSDTTWDLILRAALLGPITLIWIVFVVRVVGLRAFSKMAAFDFAVTVAIGSLLASAATQSEWGKFAVALGAIASLLVFQYIVAKLRFTSEAFRNFIGNNPVLLMREGEFLRDNMRTARVSESDVIAKLREANVLEQSDARMVILETTGDISVLHGDEEIDDILLKDVRS